MLDHAPSPDRLGAVVTALGALDLSTADPSAEAMRLEAHRLIADYLAPRLDDLRGDLVVAVVGVSGAGKSTLVNSIARRRISESGVRRPTTVEPVAWGHETLPATLDELRRRLSGRMVDTLRPPPEGVVIVDTPPPGVLDDRGVSIAEQILDVADVCIHVAGAHRYADASGFSLAERAARRGVATAFVLNRLPPTPQMSRLIVGDYTSKLYEKGLIDRPDEESIIAIAEGPIGGERDGLPSDWVTGLRKEVERHADPQARMQVVRGVIAATGTLVSGLLGLLREAVIDAEVQRVGRHDPVRMAYALEAEQFIGDIRTGRFAGAAGDPETLTDALASSAARRAGRAALHAADRWARAEPGRELPVELFTHGDETVSAARERVQFWRSEIATAAEEVSGKPVRGRRADQLVASVIRAVVDPAHHPDRTERKLLDRHAGIVELARDRLHEELTAVIKGDAGRFLTSLGATPPPGVLADLSLEDA